jgi:hypothetical protein
MLDQSVRVPISAALPVTVGESTDPRPDPGCSTSFLFGNIKRSGMKPPRPCRKTRRALRSFTRLWCRNNLIALDTIDDLSFETWVEGCDQPRKWKDKLKAAWNKDSNPGGVLDPKQTQVKGFIKDEAYPTPKAVRLINSRDDYFKCYCGPLFSGISDKLMTITEKNDWFIKYVPITDRPAVIMDKLMAPGKRYYSTDYTAYESHFDSETMRDIEFVLYDFMVSRLSAFERNKMRVIEDVLSGENMCWFKMGLVRLMASRMSGEMNTSLGNGFANLMITLFLAHKKFAGEVLGFVEGDDGLFTFEHEENAPTISDYAELGFTIKIETTLDLNKASFCGNVFDCVDMVVLTDPMEALRNFGFTNKTYVNANRNTRLQLLRSKGLSMAHQYNGVPMLSSFGRKIVELTDGVRIRKSLIDGVDAYHRERLRTFVNTALPPEKKISPQTRALVEELYDVSLAGQMEFENSIVDLTLDSKIILEGFPISLDAEWYYDNYFVPRDQAVGRAQQLNRDFTKTWNRMKTVYSRLPTNRSYLSI